MIVISLYRIFKAHIKKNFVDVFCNLFTLKNICFAYQFKRKIIKNLTSLFYCSGGVHPYYVAVQYHPEYISRPLSPSPPYLGLILAR